MCATGVRHLHSVLLVHRDVRADNFLVASRDPLRMLITDFGISHQMTDAAGTAASTSFTLIGPVGIFMCMDCYARLGFST
jgi:serine/threonine protein kinase